MNYCDENSTPRDRISAELFFSEYGTEMRTSGCGCGNTARTAQTRTTGCGCANTARTAETRTTGCGCGNTARTAQTRTTGCGCANTARTAETRTKGCGCANAARTAQTRTSGCGCGCGCGETSRTAQTRSGRNAGDGCPDRRIPAPSLAMAYVPMQQWRDILDCEDALANGTLFGELVLPFYPTPCNNEGCQRRRSI